MVLESYSREQLHWETCARLVIAGLKLDSKWSPHTTHSSYNLLLFLGVFLSWFSVSVTPSLSFGGRLALSGLISLHFSYSIIIPIGCWQWPTMFSQYVLGQWKFTGKSLHQMISRFSTPTYSLTHWVSVSATFSSVDWHQCSLNLVWPSPR